MPGGAWPTRKCSFWLASGEQQKESGERAKHSPEQPGATTPAWLFAGLPAWKPPSLISARGRGFSQKAEFPETSIWLVIRVDYLRHYPGHWTMPGWSCLYEIRAVRAVGEFWRQLWENTEMTQKLTVGPPQWCHCHSGSSGYWSTAVGKAYLLTVLQIHSSFWQYNQSGRCH